jgi:hypothetical protein
MASSEIKTFVPLRRNIRATRGVQVRVWPTHGIGVLAKLTQATFQEAALRFLLCQ